MSKGFLRVLSKLNIAILMALLVNLFLRTDALALNINVTGPNGEAVADYRWLIEEDATYHAVPGQADPGALAVRFHTSYMPVVAKGDNTNSLNIPLDAQKHYFVSVLPKNGFSMGGAPVNPDQENVTVTVQKLPIPTAQITVFVFEDNRPINNAPDIPAEMGLEGFTVKLFDAAGRYGQAGGQMNADVFGNPFGTTYNADNTVAVLGTGIIKTDINGMAVIKNIAPGKYGVKVVAPTGQNWVQTSTIEGTKTIDAWVKANEPAYFAEFGPPGQHVFIGFVKPTNNTAVLSGGSSISGQVVNMHLSRPPDYAFYNGAPFGHTTPWIGLNSATGREGLYAQRANPDGSFTIPNVPPGDYQLVVWDDNLDLIIAFLGVTVSPGGGAIALGDVPVFSWFSRLESVVFYDHNQNGFRDCVTPNCDNPTLDDIGIPDVPVNLRFRDGTLYQSFPTDLSGFVPFDEVFPFFSWLVAEVDFTRLKATGATIVVDAGGPVSPDQGWDHPSGGILTPQPQFDANGPVNNPNTNNNLSRTETGPVLLQAFQGFLGQTSRIEWGKSAYGPGENGGISGIVRYSTTRAEDDPRNTAPEDWEPGIPRVQVNLYADGDVDNSPTGWRFGTAPKGPEDIDRNNNGFFDGPDKAIDDVNGDGVVTLADVDNYPFGWRDGTSSKGLEDTDWNDNGVFDAGDAVQIVTTDSWDDNQPTGCQGEVYYYMGSPKDCFDGLRNFNQVRPGVFDGGYAFNGISPGTYIVEAAPPKTKFGQTYQIVKEEDKNVDFGDAFTASPLLLPPVCVNYDENKGLGHQVPAELALQPGVAAPFANSFRPLCDRKQVTLSDGVNAAVDFAMFTEVPIAGHILGFILDDTSNEFDPTAPTFGEKFAPPWLPISIRDWTGKELSRTYSDEWGAYNALVPSTYTMNVPAPSGASPSMITVCLNDPGPLPDPANPGQFMTDPFFNRQYSQFCYTFQYMPGTTTYLDTPVIPVAAFAGPSQFPLDCEFAHGTPKIYSVAGPVGGPYVAAAGSQITITSQGMVAVPNPAYDGINGLNPKTIDRDYGFGGTPGSVFIGDMPLQVIAWSEGAVTAIVPDGTTTGQLKVTRGDNSLSTIEGVTVTVGPIAGSVLNVAPGGSIQQAIDIALPGDLILVPPGRYDELVILWKPVQLQGWGPGSTIINAVKVPAEKLTAWRQKVASLMTTNSVSAVPGQVIDQGPIEAFGEEGAGITVLAKDVGQRRGGFGQEPNARIDGFTVTGSDNGSGIFVNGYAHYLEVSNNRVINNQGYYSGGIRLGNPYLVLDDEDQSNFNDNIYIHNNHITQNSGLGGAGGGISLFSGSDAYRVASNHICGNFTLGEGAGIGHMGLSEGGLIADNQILFNESFNQGFTVSGGGILISGAPVPNDLTEGSGSVKIVDNVIQGNLAGAGDGGAIRLGGVNGADVEKYKNKPEKWHTVDILNNIITNNVAALAGAGISLQDAVKVNILHNTITNNDSTATAGEAFAPGSPNQSTPQPAGVVSHAHSAPLKAAFGKSPYVQQYKEFSNPLLANNIIWHNRSFYFVVDNVPDPPFYGLMPDVASGASPTYWDLWVLGTATPMYMNPQYCGLTDTLGYSATNISADPMFIGEYANGARNRVIQPEATTALQPVPAFDEGGNFIDIRFGPLTLTGDYHLSAVSGSIDKANMVLNEPFPELLLDCEGQPRPNGVAPDIGADEK